MRRLRIPEKIGNTELTKQEQDMLRAGLPLKNKEIELANGRKFTTTLQANVEEKGVEFTDEQKRDYLEGKTIKLDGVPDKQGVPSTMYLKFSPEKGRPLTYANDPDKAVTQTPASESQTQVAVNNEGKTNEQTKGVKEPLQQSQTAPKDTKQKEQQDNAVKQDKPEKKKSKGMKM